MERKQERASESNRNTKRDRDTDTQSQLYAQKKGFLRIGR